MKTEKQLREEEARLEKLVHDGNATVADADKLANIRWQLKRIEAVKSGKSW